MQNALTIKTLMLTLFEQNEKTMSAIIDLKLVSDNVFLLQLRSAMFVRWR